MTKEIDPTEMTDEEVDKVANEVKRQRKREESKYGHLIESNE